MNYIDQLLPFPPQLSVVLPENVNAIIPEMAQKQATLQQWESMSYLLFKQHKYNDFITLMKYVTEYVISRYDDDDSKRVKIRLYNSLSMYHLIQATKSDGIEKASECFDSVVKNFNLSDKYDFDGLTFSIKGIYSFYRGEKVQTLDYYKTSQDQISQNDPASVHPLMGMAQVYFVVGDYKEALQCLKKAIKLNPNIPGKARLGLAYCYYHLEQYSLAYYTFLRVLQLEPNNVDAHIGLAILAYNRQDNEEYFRLLCKAFLIDQHHPVTLYHLSEHYLYKQEYERCLKCVKQGLKSLESVCRFQFKDKNQDEPFRNDWADLKSRYLYIFGFLKHIQSDYEQAFKYYNQSKQYNRNNMVLLVGLAQIYLHTQYLNYNESYKLSERLLKQYDNSVFCWELYKIIAYIHSKNLQNRKLVMDTYKKALQYNPQDSEVLIEYSQQLDNEDASQYYKTAEQILLRKEQQQKCTYVMQQQTEQIVFPELYINMGVHFCNSNLPMALDSFNNCELLLQNFHIPEYVVETSEEASKQEVQLKKSVYQVVLSYNKGILMEQMADYPNALELWKQCIIINPYFIDAYIRLAYLQHQLGNTLEALKVLQDAQVYLEQVVQHNRNYKLQNSIPMMYGYIAYQMFDEAIAKEQFKLNGDDCYSKISLMAHDYQMAADRTKNPDPQFLKNVLRQLATNGQKILAHDPRNIQAAMILIVIMAEVGKLQEALSQLENLQEYAHVQPRILSNLAILESMIGGEDNYQPAKLYFKKYLEKVNYKSDDHSDVQQAQMHLVYKNYPEAANVIKRQIFNNPGQMKHRLNLNIIIHQQCYEIVEDPKSKCNLRLLSQAITYFKCLMKSYEYMSKGICWQGREQQYPPHLRQLVRSMQFSVIREKSEDRHSYINTYQANFDTLLREAEEFEKQQKHRQELIEIERKRKLQHTQQSQQLEQDEIDIRKLEELALISEQFMEDLKKEQTEVQQGGKQSGNKKIKLSKKERKQREKEIMDEKQFMESDDESYNLQHAEHDEAQVQEDLGGNSEDQFEEQEQFEQNKPKRSKKGKKNHKQNSKNKGRLQKQEDINSDELHSEQQVYEPEQVKVEDEYNFF